MVLKSENADTKHLLVAGAEDILQFVLSTALQEAGYRVTIAKDGLEALFMIKTFNFTQRPFDLLILDSRLSQISWIKLTEKLDSLRISIPIIILSSTSTKIAQIDQKFSRTIKFLKPPFSKDEFIGTINRLMGQ